MALRARLPLLSQSVRLLYASRSSSGGGDHDTSGSIRGAGGSFAKKEKAIEDQYFHNLEVAQLQKLREEYEKHHEEEISHHEDEIRDLEEQIKRHKDKIARHKAKVEDK